MFFSKPNRQKPFMKPTVLNNKIQNRVRLLIIKHTVLVYVKCETTEYYMETSVAFLQSESLY